MEMPIVKIVRAQWPTALYDKLGQYKNMSSINLGKVGIVETVRQTQLLIKDAPAPENPFDTGSTCTRSAESMEECQATCFLVLDTL